ncbi:MAG TPA: GNAT family N-acetyltransferase [Clostridiales bacterium]|nr:GNAT family N-acetyltransferase [Clostridiales bacterium]HPP36559.1 GNAT family N-acetyltransferase [Clostridiales bacterium]
MAYMRKAYRDEDFIRIRDFLKYTLYENPSRKNWLIDRWNFGRYFSQTMHGTFDTWPETVGIWEDENNEIIAVVNSEGEVINRKAGSAFFQLGNRDFTDDFLSELIDYAESRLALTTEEGTYVNVFVDEDAFSIRKLLKEKDYTLLEWKDPMSCMDISGCLKEELPEGFRIADANEVSDCQKGFAHGRAFGYYINDAPDDDAAERCFQALRNAPDYLPELDLSILDRNGEVASFAGVWYDDLNRIGILEPVGTIPKYRRMGLGKAVVYEGINRVLKMGANRIFVGSDQQFYISIGFRAIYYKQIWQKKLRD